VSDGARAWIGVALLLGAAALAGWPLPHELLDWQPLLAPREPWRAVTAIGVHYDAQHLAANLAGAALVGGFGALATPSPRWALAWLAAWPLTQLGLLARPDLTHYGGLSGVLHAVVAVAAILLLVSARGARRWIGAAVLAGLCAKVASEAPWGPALRRPDGWAIADAPFAHLSGSVAGALCAALAAAWPGRRAGAR
jgi:rhomboid family GlyGly-CTERM serine protease